MSQLTLIKAARVLRATYGVSAPSDDCIVRIGHFLMSDLLIAAIMAAEPDESELYGVQYTVQRFKRELLGVVNAPNSYARRFAWTGARHRAIRVAEEIEALII